MSFYKEVDVDAGKWIEWRAGKCAISVDDDDFCDFVDLEEYRVRMLGQINGDHDEDVIDAMCCVIDDMKEIEPVFDLDRWYGGRYSEHVGEAMYYALHPRTSNDGISFLALSSADSNTVKLAVGFGN